MRRRSHWEQIVDGAALNAAKRLHRGDRLPGWHFAVHERDDEQRRAELRAQKLAMLVPQARKAALDEHQITQSGGMMRERAPAEKRRRQVEARVEAYQERQRHRREQAARARARALHGVDRSSAARARHTRVVNSYAGAGGVRLPHLLRLPTARRSPSPAAELGAGAGAVAAVPETELARRERRRKQRQLRAARRSNRMFEQLRERRESIEQLSDAMELRQERELQQAARTRYAAGLQSVTTGDGEVPGRQPMGGAEAPEDLAAATWLQEGARRQHAASAALNQAHLLRAKERRQWHWLKLVVDRQGQTGAGRNAGRTVGARVAEPLFVTADATGDWAHLLSGADHGFRPLLESGTSKGTNHLSRECVQVDGELLPVEMVAVSAKGRPSLARVRDKIMAAVHDAATRNYPATLRIANEVLAACSRTVSGADSFAVVSHLFSHEELDFRIRPNTDVGPIAIRTRGVGHGVVEVTVTSRFDVFRLESDAMGMEQPEQWLPICAVVCEQINFLTHMTQRTMSISSPEVSEQRYEEKSAQDCGFLNAVAELGI
eukprot:g1247.t1